MVTNKRFTVATLSGILFGFVCFGLALISLGPLTLSVAILIIISQVLIGFAIGISGYHIGHWSLHGMVIGILFSLPLAFSSLIRDNVQYDKLQIFIATIVLGMIYGLLIELITTVFFKAKQA